MSSLILILCIGWQEELPVPLQALPSPAYQQRQIAEGIRLDYLKQWRIHMAIERAYWRRHRMRQEPVYMVPVDLDVMRAQRWTNSHYNP
jgi:hypothetical protein